MPVRVIVAALAAVTLIAAVLFLAVRGRGGPTAYALVDEPTLTVLRGRVEVQVPGAAFSQVTGDTVVRVGTRIRTGPDSNALVTYFDGSTTEIEPNTEIELRRLERTPARGQVVSFQQEIGQTWNRVERLVDPASRFEVTTASAVALVRGTDFRVIVEADGRVIVEVYADAVIVEAAGVTVVVEVGFRTTIEPGLPPTPTEPIATPRFALRIEVVGPATFWATDAVERSAGLHPQGNRVGNQIPGTTLSFGSQTMNIPDPVASYAVVLTGQGDGEVTLTATGFVNGQARGQANVSSRTTRAGALNTTVQFDRGNVGVGPLVGGGTPGGLHRDVRAHVEQAAPTPTRTPTPTATATGTAAEEPTPTATSTPTATNTPVPTSTPTLVPPPTPTEVPADPTPEPTEEPAPTAEPTSTPTLPPTATETAVPTPTPVPPTPEPTSVPEPTGTPTLSPTATATSASTAVPPARPAGVQINATITPTLAPTTTATTPCQMDDDFNDNLLDTRRWETRVEPPDAATIFEVNQRLEMQLPSGSGFAGAKSRCFLEGDFDVQVDYLLLMWPLDNHASVQLRARDIDGQPVVVRASSPERYTLFKDRGFAHTSHLSGTLRLARRGSTISGCFLDDGVFRLLGSFETSRNRTQIALNARRTDPSGPPIKIAFDNFQVNSGTAQCPPPPLPASFMSDNFNDNFLDPQRWAPYERCGPTQPMVPCDIGTIQETNSRLEVAVGPGAFNAGVRHVCSLNGDFDVQVRFLLISWPSINRQFVGLFTDVRQGQFGGAGVSRLSGSDEAIHWSTGDSVTLASTTGTTATLRLVRSGASLTGFYDGQAVGTTTVSTGPARIILNVGANNPSGAAVAIAYDDFLVNGSTANCPGTTSGATPIPTPTP